MCENCEYSVLEARLRAKSSHEEGAAEIEYRRCRRHAPNQNGFPIVGCNDWCGDYESNWRVISLFL